MPKIGQAATAEEAAAKPNPVSHWKSSYVAANDDQLSNPVSKSERPVWSLNRQAYSSKRSFM